MFNSEKSGVGQGTQKIRPAPVKSLLSNIINVDLEHKSTLDPFDITQRTPKGKNPNSIISDIDTGFGTDNVLHKECAKPQYKSLLYKENYLGEFVSEDEKQQARQNLGVYSKSEISKIVSNVVSGNNELLATKEELNEAIADLNLIDSDQVGKTTYDINIFN